MNSSSQTILDAVIKKASALCPDSLALVGVYGSVATKDEHEKSDLDLLVLINDERGRILSDCFILSGTGVAYDIYCTSWQMLEDDAECNHAHLSRLLDSQIVFCKDARAKERLAQIQGRAISLLASDTRFDKSRNALDNAKKFFAEACLSRNLAEVREASGMAIEFVQNALMLYNGRYFKKGTKRAFEELSALNLPFDISQSVLDVISAARVGKIRRNLKNLIARACDYLRFPGEKMPVTAASLAGTYEEMWSNWKNKMREAAARGDVWSSFMNLLSLRLMLREVWAGTSHEDFGRGIMARFRSENLSGNADEFDRALENHLALCIRAGLSPRIFKDADDFARDYCKAIPEV